MAKKNITIGFPEEKLNVLQTVDKMVSGAIP